MKYGKGLAFSIFALILGAISSIFIFSDLSPNESIVTRIVTVVLFFLLTGVIIGYFNPSLWIIAGLTSAGGLFWGSLLILFALRRYGTDAFSAQEPPFITTGLIMLVVPATLSLSGGYVGKLINQRFAKIKLP